MLDDIWIIKSRSADDSNFDLNHFEIILNSHETQFGLKQRSEVKLLIRFFSSLTGKKKGQPRELDIRTEFDTQVFYCAG